ncbi:hypothetical protein DCAR_0311857 [Daucus carota subsp. sativus]|uniref:Replication protein A 70 kDa DNA-binding subunit B/D first OB fold domain-containing protein n=1 Tax=Daucus carota subsp. sativus TaxID=79200 RepID=A0A166AQY4_DAUCS|nr:hypothetical protein DCAR_0311857 [Daucus carota subsp. sativus]
MQEDTFRSLKNLKIPGMYEYQIKVIVTRVWSGGTYNRNGRTGMNMFLTDIKDNRMHCWLPSTLTLVFNEDFVEVESYIIKNFMVSTYKGKYRCCDDQFHIILMDSTIAYNLNNGNTVKANEIFKFTKLSTIDTSCFQDEYCIDVIGLLKERKPLDFLVKENNEEEPILDFILKQNWYYNNNKHKNDDAGTSGC